jgi:hypothetical protein
MTQLNLHVKKFIKNVISDNYKAANVNLKNVVDNKLKQKIKKASKLKLF